jgi:hypothetical protein
MGGIKTGRGSKLQREWGIPAALTRYAFDGKFFMPLHQFPGALADFHGYVVFQNKEEYESSPYINFRGTGTANPRIGVKIGISKMPGYVLKKAGGRKS